MEAGKEEILQPIMQGNILTKISHPRRVKDLGCFLWEIFCVGVEKQVKSQQNRKFTMNLYTKSTKWLSHFVLLKPLLGLVYNSRKKCSHTFVNWLVLGSFFCGRFDRNLL